MQKYTDEKDYIDSVLSNVRWKKAHDRISGELGDHIADQRRVFLERGYEEEKALRMAVQEMGDAQAVGKAFDQLYRPQIDWLLLLAVMLLLGVGLITQLYYGKTLGVLDGISLLLGGGILFLGCRLDYRRLFSHTAVWYGAYMAFLGVVCIFGARVNGLPVFLNIIGVHEYMILFPIVYACVLYWQKDAGFIGLLAVGLAAAIPLLMGLFFSSIGAVIIPGLVCLIMLTTAISFGWFGNRRLLYNVLLYSVIVMGVLAMITLWPYRIQHLQFVFHPELVPESYGYAGNCIRQALKGAKWIGPASNMEETMLTQLLPQSETHTVLANLIQQFGWIVFVLIACITLALLYRGIHICIKQQNEKGRILAIAAVLLLGITYVVGFLNNMGLLLIPSVTLPMFANGNMAMLMYLIYISLLLCILRYSPLMQETAKPSPILQKSWISYQDGVLSIRIKD